MIIFLKQEPKGGQGAFTNRKGGEGEGFAFYNLQMYNVQYICAVYKHMGSAWAVYIREGWAPVTHTLTSHTCRFENYQIAEISAQIPKEKPI